LDFPTYYNSAQYVLSTGYLSFNLFSRTPLFILPCWCASQETFNKTKTRNIVLSLLLLFAIGSNESNERRLTNSAAASNKSVAIIGAGLIGRGWAIVFARAGWSVNLYDLKSDALENARKEIASQLEMLVNHGLCSQPDVILKNISFVTELATALHEVNYVQECGPEMLDVKRALFSELDRLSAPHVILASSTSG
jgi:hypothetical protein